MSGIDTAVFRKCVEAYKNADFVLEDSIEAAILKYRELVPQPGPITAEMVAGGLAVAGWSGDALTRAERKDVAAKLNALSNRPTPEPMVVVVPEDVAAWGLKHKGHFIANWVMSLLPAPPVPEPGQREMETFCKFQPGLKRMKWSDCDQSERDGWAAVAALKGDADGK